MMQTLTLEGQGQGCRIFSKKQKEKRIRQPFGLEEVCRAFLRIAGSLLNEEKISTKDISTYFWQGFRRRFGVELRPTTYEDPVGILSEPF